MKRIIYTLTLVFVFSAIAYAEPKLEIIGGETYDWKDVSPKNNPLTAKIKIINTGSDTLHISEVKASCGCTTAPLDKNKLFKGDTATMSVTLHIGNRSQQITKTVRLTSNDPQQGTKVLYLKANIINPLELSPTSYFIFKDLKVGMESIATIKLKNTTTEKIKLSNFSMVPESVTCNLTGERVINPGEEIEILASVKPTKAGPFNCTLKMTTSSPDYPTMEINGSGRVAESELFNNK